MLAVFIHRRLHPITDPHFNRSLLRFRLDPDLGIAILGLY